MYSAYRRPHPSIMRHGPTVVPAASVPRLAAHPSAAPTLPVTQQQHKLEFGPREEKGSVGVGPAAPAVNSPEYGSLPAFCRAQLPLEQLNVAIDSINRLVAERWVARLQLLAGRGIWRLVIQFERVFITSPPSDN